jgi:hypothetical protein
MILSVSDSLSRSSALFIASSVVFFSASASSSFSFFCSSKLRFSFSSSSLIFTILSARSCAPDSSVSASDSLSFAIPLSKSSIFFVLFSMSFPMFSHLFSALFSNSHSISPTSSRASLYASFSFSMLSSTISACFLAEDHLAFVLFSSFHISSASKSLSCFISHSILVLVCFSAFSVDFFLIQSISSNSAFRFSNHDVSNFSILQRDTLPTDNLSASHSSPGILATLFTKEFIHHIAQFIKPSIHHIAVLRIHIIEFANPLKTQPKFLTTAKAFFQESIKLSIKSFIDFLRGTHALFITSQILDFIMFRLFACISNCESVVSSLF